jgi:hypothetical protein
MVCCHIAPRSLSVARPLWIHLVVGSWRLRNPVCATVECIQETDTTTAGKQARPAEEAPRTQAQQHQPQKHMAAPQSEPALGDSPANHHAGVQEAYSVGAGGHNRAAQAGNAAAHYAEADQSLPKSKSRRIDEDSIAQLVAEENATKSKFPRYPGLERWELVEKMGDGAFSNVYRARDLEGKLNHEVAIKVVRKYEMNNMQVRDTPGD